MAWFVQGGQPSTGWPSESCRLWHAVLVEGEYHAVVTGEMGNKMQVHPVMVGSQRVELPLVPLSDSVAVALMMTIDQGVSFAEQAGRELADHFRGHQVEIIAAPATLGIPVAVEVTRALDLDDYVILQKTRKTHLHNALSVELTSVTTKAAQRLLLDRRRVDVVRGRRVVLVDDVISSGGSINAAADLLTQAGAQLVGIGTLLTEGHRWRECLGSRADLVHALGTIPLFKRQEDSWVPSDGQ